MDHDYTVLRLDRLLPMATLIAFIFSLGVNYKTLVDLDTRMTQFMAEVRASYATRESQAMQVERLREQIETLQRQIDAWRRERPVAEENAATPARPRFGR